MHRRPRPIRSARPLRSAAPTRRGRSLAVVVACTLAVSLAGCTPRPSLPELDRKLYATSLSDFLGWWRQEQATAQHVSAATIDRWWRTQPERLDHAAARSRPWDISTDLCSFAPDTGPVFDFRGPCVRHDFAWRNLHRLDAAAGGGISTRSRRQAASQQFLRDLRVTCDERSLAQRPACRALASAYFAAVSAVA